MLHLKRDIPEVERLTEFAEVLAKHEFGWLIHRMSLSRFLPVHKRLTIDKEKLPSQPEEIRMVLDEMGAAFVKLGQLLSLRPDLIPQEYCDEFRKLQDEVSPLPFSEIKEKVESELGHPIKEAFSYFNERAIASASVAQVHRARLKDGRDVAVKVQRPGIERTFRTDILLLRHIAELIDRHFNPKIIRAKDILDEFERYTANELDFLIEARYLDRAHHNFSSTSKIVIPTPYHDYCTRGLLVMEFIDGRKLSEVDFSKMSRRKKRIIVSRVVNAVLKMVFEDGFFHGDPHEGNVLLLERNAVAFIDFGIAGSIMPDQRIKLANLLISILNGDVDGVAISMIKLGMSRDVDIESLKVDIRSSLSKYYDVEIKEMKLSEMFKDVIRISKLHRIRLLPDMVLLGKVAVTLEGFALSIYPDYNIIKDMRPFAEGLVAERMSPSYIKRSVIKTGSELKEFITELPKEVYELVSGIESGEEHIDRLHSDMIWLRTDIIFLAKTLALVLIISSLTIASALLVNTGGKFIYGYSAISVAGFSLAALLSLVLIVTLIKENSKRY